MHKLILLRHGESTWNKENLFTGWTDVDLSQQGKVEALNAGKILKAEGFTFDIAFTSVLKRAIRTLWIVRDELDLLWIPVEKSWRLNERHYGALQGLNKTEVAKKFGDEQVHIWRRSYNVMPPALEKSDTRHPSQDPRYKDVENLPATEALKQTEDRMLPYWEQSIVPNIHAGKKVIIAAHGNSLRALVKHLDGISEEAIMTLDIPTGIPLLYELDENLKPITHRYLRNIERIKL